jgi:hypothetical protein
MLWRPRSSIAAVAVAAHRSGSGEALFVPAHVVMANFPEASDAMIANILLETDVLKRANVTAPTVQNWLSKIRRGGIGYGR